MLLAYIDESGINYKKNERLKIFKDGPYIIWASILVHENKYLHAERLFYEIANKYLGVTDWREKELHACDIWKREKDFSFLTEEQSQKYFEEFFQLLAKLRIGVVAGLQQKNIKRYASGPIADEIKTAAYVLLTVLEHKLAEMNETAVLIVDENDKQDELQDLLWKRTQWRHSPKMRKPPKYKSKYYFENQSCFLLDHIHFVKSKNSFFIQIVDHVNYVLKRVLDYSYLKHFPKDGVALDISKVPVGVNTFKFFARDMFIGHFNKVDEDVNIYDLSLSEFFGRENEEYFSKGFIHPISEYK